MLYTLSFYNVICQLYLNIAEGESQCYSLAFLVHYYNLKAEDKTWQIRLFFFWKLVN